MARLMFPLLRRPSHFGGALNSHTNTPAAMNSHAISDSVTTVTPTSNR
jgi:hypothetical protein